MYQVPRFNVYRAEQLTGDTLVVEAQTVSRIILLMLMNHLEEDDHTDEEIELFERHLGYLTEGAAKVANEA